MKIILKLLVMPLILILVIITGCIFILECPIGVLVFIINSGHLKSGSGSGIFHTLFFRTSGCYQSCSLMRRVAEWR